MGQGILVKILVYANGWYYDIYEIRLTGSSLPISGNNYNNILYIQTIYIESNYDFNITSPNLVAI